MQYNLDVLNQIYPNITRVLSDPANMSDTLMNTTLIVVGIFSSAVIFRDLARLLLPGDDRVARLERQLAELRLHVNQEFDSIREDLTFAYAAHGDRSSATSSVQEEAEEVTEEVAEEVVTEQVAEEVVTEQVVEEVVTEETVPAVDATPAPAPAAPAPAAPAPVAPAAPVATTPESDRHAKLKRRLLNKEIHLTYKNTTFTAWIKNSPTAPHGYLIVSGKNEYNTPSHFSYAMKSSINPTIHSDNGWDSVYVFTGEVTEKGKKIKQSLKEFIATN